MAEKWVYYQWWNETTGQCIDNEGWTNGWDNDTICFSGLQPGSSYWSPPSSPNVNNSVLPQSDFQTGWSCGNIFDSAHRNGFGAVFCDGSVHFLHYGLNPATWRNLCSISDGNTVDPSDF